MVGEVAVCGDNVMLGYWKRPEETARAVVDGWMYTGDGGYLDADGFLYVVDRIKDMIISGGENVYSAEVENVIAQHPAVAQCAVIGIPSQQWGEQVHAVVVPRPDVTLAPGEVMTFCKTLIGGLIAPEASRSGKRHCRYRVTAAAAVTRRTSRPRMLGTWMSLTFPPVGGGWPRVDALSPSAPVSDGNDDHG